MSANQVTYYSFEDCREFIEARARELAESASGLDKWATYRELIYSFSYEALEQSSITIGQFDPDLVFIFIPWNLSREDSARGQQVARAKAEELLGAAETPVVLELLASQSDGTAVGDHGKIEGWMRQEFLDEMILSQRISILLFIDAGGFFERMLKPQLERRRFELIDDYDSSARSGMLRVRHPGCPGKTFKLPWLMWVREMMGGGYNLVYLMACFAAYLQKLETAVSE